MRLDNALNAWGTPGFEAALTQELAHHRGELPLQEGLSVGSYVIEEPVTIVVNSVSDMGSAIRVRAGVFYRSVIGGCSCADDPTPTPENTEYCEVLCDINKATALATVALITG